MACYEATFHAIWLWNFISSLEVIHSISRPLNVFCDNSAVVSFSRNTMSTSRKTRMLADPLNKGLPICVFQEHVTQIGLLEAYTLCFSESFAFSCILEGKLVFFRYYMHILTFVIIF